MVRYLYVFCKRTIILIYNLLTTHDTVPAVVALMVNFCGRESTRRKRKHGKKEEAWTYFVWTFNSTHRSGKLRTLQDCCGNRVGID